MAVTVADLMAPAGPLEPNFFPDAAADRVTRLEGYLARAVTKVAGDSVTDEDAAVEAWALHLAFQALYLIKSNAPASENLGAMGLPSQSWTDSQMRTFRQQADEWKLVYEGLQEIDTTEDNLRDPGRTRAVTTRIRF